MTLSEAFEKNGLSDILTNETENKLIKLYGLLSEFNRGVNVTAVTDEAGVYVKHYADSLTLLPYIEGGKLLDIGCGGGFPSLPLAVAEKDIFITSMDSTAKKLGLINKAKEELGVDNITALCGRAEELCAPPLRESFDTVCARAVAALPVLCELCIPYVKTGGVFIAMKTDASELDTAEKAIKQLGASLERTVSLELYSDTETMNRCLIIIRKTGKTDKKYPRRYAQIKAKPL